MENKTTLEILKNIIDEEMNMPIGRVFAYNASQDLPKDKELFIVLSYMSRTPYSNSSKYIYEAEGLKENQSISLKEDIIISLISNNIDARERCYEVEMALRSQFSLQLQQKHHIHISQIGMAYDASFLEATARLNRFDVRCTVFRSYTKIKDVDFYDKFPNTSKLEAQYLIEE